MKPPLSIRPLTEDEQRQLDEALRATDAFRLRRAQYLLASAKGLVPLQIATTYGGCQQNVRNVIRAFNAVGLGCLTPQSRRPKSACPQLSGHNLERLQDLLHQSPRLFGKNTSVWTQPLLAEVAFEQGLTEQTVSHETIRQALKRLKTNWTRAKHWITSPDPHYLRKKTHATDSFASQKPTRTGC
jgi:transposase